MANNDFLDFSQWAVKQPDVAANEPAMPDFSNQAVAPAAPAKTEDNPDNKDDDPYLHEKRPVRRHGLFRRILQ